MKLVDTAKLDNLQVLALPLCEVDKAIASSLFCKLVDFLPKLQELIWIV